MHFISIPNYFRAEKYLTNLNIKCPFSPHKNKNCDLLNKLRQVQSTQEVPPGLMIQSTSPGWHTCKFANTLE